MNIRRNLIVAVLMTIVTTVLLGLIYPLVVTALAQALFKDKANGQLRERDGRTIGPRSSARRSRRPATSTDGRPPPGAATTPRTRAGRISGRPTRS